MMSVLSFGLLLSSYGVSATTVFHSNCTLPDASVHFVSGPNARGTLEIVWSSLATIIACVYTVLHLNVPEQRQGRNSGWLGDMYWTMKRAWRSVMYSILTTIIPELMLSKTILDLEAAKQRLKMLHDTVPGTKDTYTLQHILYADMGGFVVTYDRYSMPRTSGRIGGEDPLASLEHGVADSYVNGLQQPQDKLGAHCSEQQPHGPPKKAATLEWHQTAIWHLNSDTLIDGIRRGLFPLRPPITVEGIADRSKADLLGKLVAIAQITYFVIATIARAANHLSISQLELGACAFVPYAMAIYAYSHLKVKSPQTVDIIAHLDQDVCQGFASADKDYDSIIVTWDDEIHLDGKPIPDYAYRKIMGRDGMLGRMPWLVPVLLSAPFGAVHIAAWNFSFPTVTDAMLWRIAACLITGVLPAGVMLFVMLSKTPDRQPKFWIEAAVLILMILVYLLARIVIIVELFRTLAYLPTAAFVSTWTSNVPHIG